MGYEKYLKPSRAMFHSTPFEYANLSSERWVTMQKAFGGAFEQNSRPGNQDFKDPLLWWIRSRALLYAARAVVADKNVDFGFPDHPEIQSLCDSDFCAAGLMLLGYSLEVMLKGMTMMENGVEEYRANERDYLHHRLDKLSSIVPNLSARDVAMLRTLSYFTSWAGRYPDPGEKRTAEYESIFKDSERHKITFDDLLDLANRVMLHATTYGNKVRDHYRKGSLTA